MNRSEKIQMIEMVVGMKIGDMFDDIRNTVIVANTTEATPDHKAYGSFVHYNVIVFDKDKNVLFDEYYQVGGDGWNEKSTDTRWKIEDTNTLNEVLHDIEYNLGDLMRAQDKAMGI